MNYRKYIIKHASTSVGGCSVRKSSFVVNKKLFFQARIFLWLLCICGFYVGFVYRCNSQHHKARSLVEIIVPSGERPSGTRVASTKLRPCWGGGSNSLDGGGHSTSGRVMLGTGRKDRGSLAHY